MAKVITIASQKGGTGKTTLTMLAASYFAYEKKHKVAVLDVDDPQHAFYKWRQGEEKLLTGGLNKEKFIKQGIGLYPVTACSLDTVLDYLDKIEKDYDFIFLDTPGTVSNPLIWGVYNATDFIFVPFEPDTLAIRSTIESAINIMNNIKSHKSTVEGVYAFWNKFNSNISTTTRSALDNVLLSLPFTGIMKNRVGHSLRIKNPDCRSTLFPPANPWIKQNNGVGVNIGGFLTELESLINK